MSMIGSPRKSFSGIPYNASIARAERNPKSLMFKGEPRRDYYDNSLVVEGFRVAATFHPKHGWGWFFENKAAPVQGWQELKNIRDLEAEVRAALPPEFIATRRAMTDAFGPPVHEHWR